MGMFDNGELLQDNQDMEFDASDYTEEGGLDPGDEVEGAEGQEDGQAEEETQEEKLLAGNYKTFGGLAQAYLRQRDKLGLQNDLQNYGTPEALEKAFLRDKERLRSRAGIEEPEEASSLEDMSEIELISEYNRQQAAIQAALQQQAGPQVPPMMQQGQYQQVPQQYHGQQPGYNYSQHQQVPQQVQRHPILDDYRGTSEQFIDQWMENPVSMLRDIIRGELEIQGSMLGQALQGVISPMMQTVTQIKTQAQIDKEWRNLDKKMGKKGIDIDDYSNEINVVFQQYPGLINVEKGLEQALQMAVLQKQISGKRTKAQSKAGLRVNAGKGGSGIPKSQYGQPPRMTAEESERRKIFGDPKTRGIFDD